MSTEAQVASQIVTMTLNFVGSFTKNTVALIAAAVKEGKNVAVHAPGEVGMKTFLKNNPVNAVYQLPAGQLGVFKSGAAKLGMQFCIVEGKTTEDRPGIFANEIAAVLVNPNDAEKIEALANSMGVRVEARGIVAAEDAGRQAADKRAKTAPAAKKSDAVRDETSGSQKQDADADVVRGYDSPEDSVKSCPDAKGAHIIGGIKVNVTESSVKEEAGITPDLPHSSRSKDGRTI